MPNIMQGFENESDHCVGWLLAMWGASLDVSRFQRIQSTSLHHALEIDLVTNASDADVATCRTLRVVRLDDCMRNVVVKIPAWNFVIFLVCLRELYKIVSFLPPFPWYIHFVAGAVISIAFYCRQLSANFDQNCYLSCKHAEMQTWLWLLANLLMLWCICSGRWSYCLALFLLHLGIPKSYFYGFLY